MASVDERAVDEFWISDEGLDPDVLMHEIPLLLGPDTVIGAGRNNVSGDVLISQRVVSRGSKVYIGGQTWIFYQSSGPPTKVLRRVRSW